MRRQRKDDYYVNDNRMFGSYFGNQSQSSTNSNYNPYDQNYNDPNYQGSQRYYYPQDSNYYYYDNSKYYDNNSNYFENYPQIKKYRKKPKDYQPRYGKTEMNTNASTKTNTEGYKNLSEHSELKEIARIISQKDKINDIINQIKVDIPEHTKSLIFDLIECSLECMICNEFIEYNDETWNCEKCWTIYHNKCIYDWIFKLNVQSSCTAIEDFKWTCPHCNAPHKAKSDNLPRYNCFCTKYFEAEEKQHPSFNPNLIPHGCGLECGKEICKHIKHCPLPCHPGPHVTCTTVEKIKCHCGKKEKEVPCSISIPKSYSCGELCNKRLNCGKENHTCKAICHEGNCEIFQKNKKCYECIAESKLKFFSFLEKLENKIKFECKEGEGLVSLASGLSEYIFHGELLCKFHYVESNTDNNLKFLLKLLQISGNNLVENIKKFIPVCKTIVENSCDCKGKKASIECYKINYPDDIMTFLSLEKEKALDRCSRPCKSFKNCKNHRCMRVCCELSNKKITNYSLEDPMGYHLCLLECGKILACGVNKCENYCHRGACKPCANIIREGSISCQCGKTKIESPYQCGISVVCNYPCSRPSMCEHKCKLLCHKDECPQCEEITFKRCSCRKNVIEGIKCGDTNDVHCLTKCNEMLPCGVHFCQLICHNHTEEFDINYFCNMPCGRTFTQCSHKCNKRCHGEEDCNEIECEVPVKISCKCKVFSRTLKCGEYKALYDRDKEFILPCIDECMKQSRLKKIEEAFEGLLKISEDKIKKLYPNASESVFIEGEEVNVKFADVKYDYHFINFAKSKVKLFMLIEDTIEKAVRNMTLKLEIPNVEKKSFALICDFLRTYYNIKAEKLKKVNENFVSIILSDCSEAMLPKYRVSLFALLFRHHLFTDEAIRKKEIPIFHPFEFSIFIKNYRLNVTIEEIENYILSLGKLSKTEFYLDEIDKGQCYAHFFDIDLGKKIFQQIKTKPSQFQEAYEIEYPCREVKRNELYFYLKNEDYYTFLYDGWEANYGKQLKDDKESQESLVDADGFIKVSNKKKQKLK